MFMVRDLSPETDKIYPSTRLLLAFLLQNNEMHIVKDKKPNSKHTEFSCIKYGKLL